VKEITEIRLNWTLSVKSRIGQDNLFDTDAK
jgi:hypothetical protein